MKISPSADYTVRVRREDLDEPTQAHLYADIFSVTLNHEVDIAFVPDMSGIARPWQPELLPTDLDAITTAQQACLATALFEDYAVTPHPDRAGTEERVDWPDSSCVLFYVTPAEFARYDEELGRLTSVAGDLHSFTPVSALRNYSVITFIERRVVASSWLQPAHAATLGQQR